MAVPDPDLPARLAVLYQRDLDEARERAVKLREALAAAREAIAGKTSDP